MFFFPFKKLKNKFSLYCCEHFTLSPSLPFSLSSLPPFLSLLSPPPAPCPLPSVATNNSISILKFSKTSIFVFGSSWFYRSSLQQPKKKKEDENTFISTLELLFSLGPKIKNKKIKKIERNVKKKENLQLDDQFNNVLIFCNIKDCFTTLTQKKIRKESFKKNKKHSKSPNPPKKEKENENFVLNINVGSMFNKNFHNLFKTLRSSYMKSSVSTL